MSFTAKAAKSAKDENELSRSILDAAFRVHSPIGPGLLESAYEACLAYELRAEGFRVLTQVPLPLVYREVSLDVGYRLDLLVEDLSLSKLRQSMPCWQFIRHNCSLTSNSVKNVSGSS